ERVHGAERGSHRHDGAYEVGGEVEECLEALESPLHLISLAPRLEVQGGIRLKRGAKRIEVPRGLELDADVREGVAPEYRHGGHGGTRPDEREEHPGTGSAAVSLHEDDGLIPDEGLAIAP